jgi:hypothetical protein
MSNFQSSGTIPAENPRPLGVDMKLEVAVLPVADIDRAEKFLW